jgi:DNA-binding transcriptional ArsR family regulator
MVKDLSPPLLEQVAERFRVLGDGTRLLLLQTLMQADGELNVGELVDRLQMSQANISTLRILLDAGMVARRPAGTAAYYSVTDSSVVSSATSSAIGSRPGPEKPGSPSPDRP